VSSASTGFTGEVFKTSDSIRLHRSGMTPGVTLTALAGSHLRIRK
jgi:hypothetical protein